MPYKTTDTQREYWKEYREKHKERRKLQLREWRKANPDKLRAQNQRYYERSKEKQSDYGKDYYSEHKIEIKERHASYYRLNKNSFKVRSDKWRKENSERAKEYIKEWASKNPEKRRAASSKRRALINGAKIDEVDIMKLLDTMVCGICDLDIEGIYHIDHIIPLSKGGTHSVDNLQLAHPLCNLKKGAKILA